MGNDTKTLKISEVIKILEEYKESNGDIQIVLYDVDTSWYFTFTESNIVLQENDEGFKRLSIGINSYQDDMEDNAYSCQKSQ